MTTPYEHLAVDETIALRQLQPHQAAQLFKLVDANRDRLALWLPWVDGTRTPVDSEHFIHSVILDRINNGAYGFGIFVGGELAGHITLFHLTDGQPPEIGYWIAETHAGQNIMTRCVAALTTFGLQELGIPEIVIRADPNNHASNRVAEKAGYERLGDDEITAEGEVVQVWHKQSDTTYA